MQNLDKDDFHARLNGTFYGVLKWDQLDVLWDKVKAGQWYFYQIGEALPEVALSSELLAVRLDALTTLLRKDHEFDFCGIVYADNLDAPTLVKVYDPNHIGTSCGSPEGGSPAAWILSIAPPALIEAHAPSTNSRKRWWQLFD
ncbi:MAG: hypothetical protein Q8O24_08250 [Gallionellaceae bacterium]|nr:hypothetical protein [Gallionellaceae bacterium]